MSTVGTRKLAQAPLALSHITEDLTRRRDGVNPGPRIQGFWHRASSSNQVQPPGGWIGLVTAALLLFLPHRIPAQKVDWRQFCLVCCARWLRKTCSIHSGVIPGGLEVGIALLNPSVGKRLTTGSTGPRVHGSTGQRPGDKTDQNDKNDQTDQHEQHGKRNGGLALSIPLRIRCATRRGSAGILVRRDLDENQMGTNPPACMGRRWARWGKASGLEAAPQPSWPAMAHDVIKSRDLSTPSTLYRLLDKSRRCGRPVTGQPVWSKALQLQVAARQPTNVKQVPG